MKIQDYLLKKSDSTGALWIVFFLTLCESIFLFIPPEVFMTPPIVANKKKAASVVMAAALGSLVGGIIAYLIGMWLFDSIGVWLIDTFSSMDKFEIARNMLTRYGLLIIFIAAVTPVPYKLLCIAAGFIRFNPILFIGVSAIFRTARFAVVGYLLWRFQEKANTMVKKHFWSLTLGAIAVAAIGLLLMLLL